MPLAASRPIDQIDQIIHSLCRIAPSLQEKRILAGFDGFIDTIAKPVRAFGVNGECGHFATIAEFGAFIEGHSHKSTSIQYEVQERKPGGNMPNFVAALDALSLKPTAVGMLSTETGGIDPLFQGLGKLRYSYFAAGPATAFEFTDGKIFFSPANVFGAAHNEKMFPRIKNVFPQFPEAVAASDLTAFLNWSELPFAQDLWDDIYIHALNHAEADKTRYAFFDPCDTSAKSPFEIEALFDLIGKISGQRGTILSVNKNEALDLCGKITGKARSVFASSIEEAAELLFRRLSIDELVVHQHTESMALCAQGMATEQCVLNKNPKISTGAGDHFNAAYCYASLAGLPVAEKLRFATSYSGAYIAKGSSPSLQDIGNL